MIRGFYIRMITVARFHGSRAPKLMDRPLKLEGLVAISAEKERLEMVGWDFEDCTFPHLHHVT